MSIASIYEDQYQTFSVSNAEFAVSQVTDSIFVGIDKSRNICVLISSRDPRKNPVSQRTQQISVECNASIVIEIAGIGQAMTVHVIRCYASTDTEKKIFLDLCDTFYLQNHETCSLEYVLEVFQTLASFFSAKEEISDIELQGIYAELYTIKHFAPVIPLEKYWQSKDKLKFDFSLNSHFKLEVKSTQKDERKHHFRHEQLITEIYDILVISYKLRFDDEGLSLFDLLAECKEILSSDPEKYIKLCSVLKDVTEERLHSMKFDEKFTVTNMKYIDSRKIPRFDELTPDGVSNAEYDCILNNIESIPEEAVVEKILKETIFSSDED